LHTGLRLNQQIAGIVCLSGYLPWHNFLIKDMAVANRSTQIFMAHGLFDPVVPINLGKNSYDALVNLNYNVSWNTYVMQHAVVDQEIIDIETFFKKILIL
jgi:phospholipase/carboxylesterase